MKLQILPGIIGSSIGTGRQHDRVVKMSFRQLLHVRIWILEILLHWYWCMYKCVHKKKVLELDACRNFPWPLSASSVKWDGERLRKLQTRIQSNLTTVVAKPFFRVSPDSLVHNGTTHVSFWYINVAGCVHYRGALYGFSGGLHGRFGVAVRWETLDVDLGDGQLVGDVVSVLNGRRLWKSLTERRLFLQHGRQGRIASLAITSI